jgi:uncharacterized protein Veg
MVKALATKETLIDIKKNIEENIGCKVVLRTNKGRKKVNVREGILEDAYPSVFTVRIDSGLMSERKVSYSYSDVLTETVELSMFNNLLASEN